MEKAFSPGVLATKGPSPAMALSMASSETPSRNPLVVVGPKRTAAQSRKGNGA